MTTRFFATTTIMIIGAMAVAHPLQLEGQEPEATDSLPAYVIEGITITGGRVPETRADLPRRTEVVTSADLARTAASNVADALKANASVDVIEYPGLLAGVSIRGFRPQYSGISTRTLILVDGHPAGTTNLATLDVSAIERIEVLEGPASTLYGSSAMAGAINVVTRHSRGTPHAAVSGAYGSFQTYRTDVSAGGNVTRSLDFDFSASAAGRRDGYRTGGDRLLDAGSISKTLASGGTVQLDEMTGDTLLSFTEFATRSASLRVGYALGDGWRLDARGGLFRGDHIQTPGDITSSFPFPTLNDLSRDAGEARISGDIGSHALSLRVFSSRESNAYYDNPRNPTFVNSRAPNRWYGVQFQDVVPIGPGSLVAGVDHTTAKASSETFSAPDEPSAPYNPASAIHSTAAFARETLELLDGRLTASLSGRLDHIAFRVSSATLYDGSIVTLNREDRTVFNPGAGLLYRAGGGVRLHGTIGKAFVSPDAFSVAGYSERRVPGRDVVAVTRGNPDLDPENSVTWDAGLGLLRPAQGVDLDLTYFHTDVRDRITPAPLSLDGVALTPGGDTIQAATTFVNADRAAIRGLEARASYDFGARTGFDYSLRLFANATRLLRAREVNGATTRSIRNVANFNSVAGIEYDDLEHFALRLSTRYVGSRVDDDFNDFANPGEIHYPRYLVTNLSTTLRFGDRYRLGAAVNNLTDENYYEVRGYPMPGRSLRLTIGIDF